MSIDAVPDLRLLLLGSPHLVWGDGTPLAFRSRKHTALLIYLAVEQQCAWSRDALVGLLWPEVEEEVARNNLRVALAHVRRAVGETSPPLLLVSRNTLQFNPHSNHSVDVLDLRALLRDTQRHAHASVESCATCLGRLEQAAALYRGEFLHGFILPDASAWEEWAQIQREQMHQMALEALHILAAASQRAGDHASQCRYARRQIELEPWRESAHVQLMQGLWASGQRGAALEQYAACVRVLADELGIEPEATTTALYQAIKAGNETAPEAAPPVRQTPALSPQAANTLPALLTPCIGRDAELAELIALARSPDVRLITLVGVGGIGKTHLSLEFGRARLHDFRDGAVFVQLAPLTDPHAIASAILAALGIATTSGDPRQMVVQVLRPKQLLLLLDNFEHLLGGASIVTDILQHAPEVEVVASSRERLNLRGEHPYMLHGLAYAQHATLAEATDAAAVRVFVLNAKRVHRAFKLREHNLAGVLRICQLVDGLPLGLELAAAWAEALSPTEIAAEIERSADFLQSEWRDTPERHHSLRAVFEWSWQLLNQAERRVVRGFSVFRGGATRAAAEAVIDAPLRVLTRLTHTSLLRWVEPPNGVGRYEMHELLRQFAAEELDAAGERALAEERHGRYYLAYLAARGRRLGRGEPREASSEIRAELDNVRLAWQWAVARGRLADIEQATYAWWQFCQFQGLEFEGRQSFAAAVDGVRRQLADEADTATVLLGQHLLAKLLAIHANYLFAQGRDQEMAAQAREAVALGAASGGVEGETFGTFVVGRVLQDFEQKREAGEMWQRTIHLVQLYQPAHPESELLHEAHWRARYWLRGTALHFGDYVGSRTLTAQALQMCQTLGKRWSELFCLVGLAGIDFFLYDFASAEAGFVAALDLERTMNCANRRMVAQEGWSGVLRLRGDYTRARALLEQAVNTAAELAFPYDEALFLAALIRLLCQLGDQAGAAQRYEQLAQLLAHVKLAKECHLYAHLAAAIKAHAAGDLQEALHHAQQAEQVNKQGGDILFRLVDTALVLGHVRAAVGQWEAARAAFQQALDAFQHFGNRALAAEPQAGLAHIALAQGDLAGAHAQIEALLPVLAEQPHAGYTNPFFIYLTGYRVLAATGDSRASALLQQGHDLLQQDAAALDDISRQRFVSAVPIHRNLVAAYIEIQANSKDSSDGLPRPGLVLESVKSSQMSIV